MKRIRPTSRALFAGLGLALLGGSLGLPNANAAPAAPERAIAPAAPAAPAALQASGPFSATANTSLLTVGIPALSPAILPQTNVDVANSLAIADSIGTPRTAATAGTTGTSTVLGAPLAVQETAVTAPPSASASATLLPLDLPPLVNLPVINTSAIANWISDTECVSATEPLSQARQFAADADIVQADPGSLIELDPGDDGAVDSLARTGLPSIPGPLDQRAIEAIVDPTITSVNVLNNLVPGLADLIQVEVLNDPGYVVRATGIAGGATVVGDDPIVQVTVAGTLLAAITSSSPPQEAEITDLVLGDLLTGEMLSDLADDLGLPIGDLLDPLGLAIAQALAEISPVVRLTIPVERIEAADGTTAAVNASILRIELLAPDAVGGLEPLAAALNQIIGALGGANAVLGQIDLGPMSARVVAPAGGIFCGAEDPENPLELQKVHSGPAIPGSTFDYTIAVGNISDNLGQPCTMNPVSVTDIVTGPAGTTIVSTEPAGATVTPIDGGFRIEWANVGPIAPGGRTTLRIRVGVPETAQAGQRYNDVVSTRVLCDGREITDTKTLPEPVVETRPSGPCNITGSTKAKSHINVYPGESFVYFVNVYNSGGAACTGVTVTDALDSRLTFESCSDGCTVDGRNVTWNLGTVNPGQSLTLRVQVKVNLGATGTLANAALIDTNETPPTTVNVAGPNITTFSELSPGDPARTPDRGLARTGGTTTMPLIAAVTLAAAALGRHQLRRRTAS